MKRTARSSEARRSEPSAVKTASAPVRSLPQRTCVACRTARAKRELVRVVRSPTGELSVDLRGKASGRGAYLDPADRLRVELAAAAKERRSSA